jgi:hypothetical protein
MSKLKFLGFILTVSLLAIFCLTTCDSPMGMGPPIDWEAPVLTVDTVPNPYYVRKGSVLTGTVVDNVGVDKMVFLNSATGEELFPVIREGKKWIIYLGFTDAQNNQKIVGQIIAYDKAGNSGDTSIAFITMIVDIKPPVLTTLEIKRTDSKNKILMYYDEDKKAVVVPDSYNDLKALEGSDRKDDLYRYQNGWFYITGIINESETRVKSVSLEFYDYREINTRLYSLPYSIEEGSLDYPKWLIKEEVLLDAGQAKFGGDYKSKYYSDSSARYYYRVVIKAFDMSDNENIQDDSLCICLWADSDKPKGIADPGIVGTEDRTTLPKGTPIPVEFYDDDSLLWAYTGLIKKDQWGNNGAAGVAGKGTAVTQTGTDAQKLQWLKERLTGATGDNVTLGTQGTFNDWNGEKIIDQIKNQSMDQKLVYVMTGNTTADYGDYILFTIAADKKLDPHTNAGPQITNQGRWAGRTVEVNLKDENAPLIVFDTTAGCPEENTFPDTLAGGNSFNLIGYTMRENGDGTISPPNKVNIFRMAWIPYKIQGGQDSKITAVQNALKDPNYGTASALFTTDLTLAGVQHWNFTVGTTVTGGTPAPGALKLDAVNSTIPGSTSKYTKQSFSKKFNVMGGADDVKTSTYNFRFDPANPTVNTESTLLENETKLFIFYAIDNTGNEVFRQLPILGFKNNPKMVILDITNNLLSMPSTTSSPSVTTNIPNPTESIHFTPSTGAPTDIYYGKLNTYNKYPAVITALRNASTTEIIPGAIKESQAFATYPRGTTIKYWVKATEAEGNTIPINTLIMEDITFASTDADRKSIGGGFNSDKTFSFCEWYPDVTQRTFLFTATDMLGNKASVQRTVAVSNAARLESITTTEQDGTYGHTKVIVLQANFSSQIYVGNDNGGTGTALTDQTKKPSINIRYKLKGQTDWTYESIYCNTASGGSSSNGYGLFSTPTISLTFNFTVPENALSALETIYEGNKGSGGNSKYDRPITVADGTKIYDQARKDSAFIPGYISGNITVPNWQDTTNTLQPKKAINLDGVHPRITLTSLVDTKAAYTGTGAAAEYYFKTGDSIGIQLTADKPIRALGNSRLSYTITPKSGTPQTYTASFKYQKPVTGDSSSLIYSLKIDAASCPIDGELTNVSLYRNTSNAADSDIVDNYDNNIESATNLLNGKGRFFIKQKVPDAPAATISNDNANITDRAFANNDTTLYLNGLVTLKVPVSPNSTTNRNEYEDRAQYSTDGGLTWTPALTSTANTPISPATPNITAAGAFKLRARYVDRAGNEGTAATQSIEINNSFPALISVNAVQANGWYNAGKNLTFNLNFADTVYVRTPANVTITLKNRAAAAIAPDVGNDIITLQTNMTASTTNGFTKITFEWANISGKEMREGLYISDVVLTGLQDKFGITGPTQTGSYTGTPPTGGNFSISTNCANLAAGLKVDSIAPTVTGRTPLHDTAPTNNVLVKTITLTFREPVMKGSGVITIKPRGNYAIPPVLDDTGYYLGYTTDTGVESADGPVPTKYTTPGTNRTYISSFYDIYNSLGTADRLAMTQSTSTTAPSMSALKLNDRTGQSYGPYKKMTQGLVSGYGYNGDYTGTDNDTVSGKNAPDANRYTGMIPDTATKWVLDYQYSITGTNAEVTAIRNALTNAKWRWQEIDVVSTDIPTNSNTVTITLNEPLLKGLDWDVYYPEGTFTDLAGNNAPGSGVTKAVKNNAATNIYTGDVSPGADAAYVTIFVNGSKYTAYVVSNTNKTFRIHPFGTNTGGNTTNGQALGSEISVYLSGSDYFFTSPGVQAPVIRVDRRSYDGRNSNWASSTNRTYSAPPNTTTGGTTGWDTNAAVISDKGLAADTGWGIQDFNYVHYRVETESSAAKTYVTAPSVTAQTFKGTAANKGAVTAAWSGNVQTGTLNNGASLVGTNMAWDAPASTTRGTWILSNLIRRSWTTVTNANDTPTLQANRSYTVVTKSGVPELRTPRVADNPLRMFRSYNKDLLKSELDAPLTNATLNNGQGVISFNSLEAGKNYVVGTASYNGQSVKGYEGVFRTVIVLNYSSDRNADNFIQVQGSNIKNGMPSVAGFPVRDAEETGDNRYTKVFYAAQPADTPAGTSRRTYYWVSTEVVCEWYFLHWGRANPNGTHMNVGEVNNYLMVGYGDLTYGFNLTGSGGNLN